MNSPDKDFYKIPTVWLDSTNKSAYSIFNPNNWIDNSKAIIMSCASQYSLLEYQASKIPSLCQYSQKICELRFKDELNNQWEKSPWKINKGDYLVEIPEFHLNIQAYLATIKVFLDLIVQLISSESIVSTTVQGFHKKGEIIGGQLLAILENNAIKEKRDTARTLLRFINGQKKEWIDRAVNVRDLMVHPDKGMLQVMFRLEIELKNGKLKLQRVLSPSLDGMQFDQYAQITLMQVDYFSKSFIEILKAA